MRVTVLGCGAAFPRAGGACSGYLVEGEGATVWVDAGNGTLSNLQRHLSYRDVDALVLSHRHADHIADVLPFMYALGFDPATERAVPVYAPPDVAPTVMEGHGEHTRAMFSRVFRFAPLDRPFEVGGLRFEPFRTLHPVQTYGVRIREGARTLVYTADTALFPELVEACRGADLLLCEATYVDGVQAPPGMHLWASECGRVASGAGCGRLVLVHVWATIDLERSVAEAARAFRGPVEAAVEGRVYEL